MAKTRTRKDGNASCCKFQWFFQSQRQGPASASEKGVSFACRQHFTLPPTSLSLSFSVGGWREEGEVEERSIYLISSISRLIFSPGLTKRDGKESERGREGEADRDRDRPERKKERKKERSESDEATDRPSCWGPRPTPHFPLLPPFLHSPLRDRSCFVPSRCRLSFAAIVVACGTPSVAAWLTGRSGGRCSLATCLHLKLQISPELHPPCARM